MHIAILGMLDCIGWQPSLLRWLLWWSKNCYAYSGFSHMSLNLNIVQLGIQNSLVDNEPIFSLYKRHVLLFCIGRIKPITLFKTAGPTCAVAPVWWETFHSSYSTVCAPKVRLAVYKSWVRPWFLQIASKVRVAFIWSVKKCVDWFQLTVQALI